MLFFAAEPQPEPAGLILSIAEAARQRAQGRRAAQLAREATHSFLLRQIPARRR